MGLWLVILLGFSMCDICARIPMTIKIKSNSKVKLEPTSAIA